MKEVKVHLDYEKMSVEERRKYEKMLDIQRGWKSSIDTAKIEGKAKEKIEIAKKLLKMGLSTLDIAKGTGLSIEQINEISK
jgi:predicted transposase/invertase (TIGR01784 family)